MARLAEDDSSQKMQSFASDRGEETRSGEFYGFS